MSHGEDVADTPGSDGQSNSGPHRSDMSLGLSDLTREERVRDLVCIITIANSAAPRAIETRATQHKVYVWCVVVATAIFMENCSCLQPSKNLLISVTGQDQLKAMSK